MTKMVKDYNRTEDRMSMSYSVEERVPFLDRDLVDFAFSIPAGLKIKGGRKKSLLRSAMSPLLPKEIIEKKKWGFTINPYLQFQKDLKQTIEKILTKEFVENQGIFNYSYIRSILDYKPNPKLRWHYNFLWILTGLAIWEKCLFIAMNFFKKDIIWKRTIIEESFGYHLLLASKRRTRRSTCPQILQVSSGIWLGTDCAYRKRW